MDHLGTPEATKTLRTFLRRRPAEAIRADALAALEVHSQRFFLPAKSLARSILFLRYCERVGLAKPNPAVSSANLLHSIGVGERTAKDVVGELEQDFITLRRREGRNRHCDIAPYWITVEARDRLGLVEALSAGFARMGLNMRYSFPLYMDRASAPIPRAMISSMIPPAQFPDVFVGQREGTDGHLILAPAITLDRIEQCDVPDVVRAALLQAHKRKRRLVREIIGVDVFWGQWNIWVVGQIQRMQVMSIARSVLRPEEQQDNNPATLMRDDAKRLLELAFARV